jgi:hypothetical protein
MQGIVRALTVPLEMKGQIVASVNRGIAPPSEGG